MVSDTIQMAALVKGIGGIQLKTNKKRSMIGNKTGTGRRVAN